MTEQPQDPFGWVGSTVAGKYRVDAVVAEGGFGVVYRAQHLGFDSRVALKCLKLPAQLSGAERDQFLDAFVAEGKLLHQLSRETVGIVQALDVGAETSPNGTWTPYLVLEWLEGTPLDADLSARAVARIPRRTFAEALALLEPAARALGIAHDRGIVHRDIKPQNLFIATIGGRTVVKVVDFGIAKVMTEMGSTRAFQATGASLQAFTPQYGAPEQFDRVRYGATGPWTDVFALALVLVEVLSGKPALDGGDTTQFFISSVHPERRPTPRQLGVALPDAVEAVMIRAVAVDPRQRFDSASAFWDALEAATRSPAITTAATEFAAPILLLPTPLMTPTPVYGSTTSPHMSPAPVHIPPAPARVPGSGRTMLTVALVALVAVSGVAFAVLFATHHDEPPPTPPIHFSAIGAAATPAASAGATTAPSRDDDVRSAVAKWNAAEDRHDVDALESMYAERVRFFHSNLTPRQCGDLLRKLYASSPSFVQQVENVSVTPALGGADSRCASFKKTYPAKDGTATVRAYLVFDARLRIEEESDDRTDHNMDPTGTAGVYRCPAQRTE